MDAPIVSVTGLTKVFKKLTAVDHVTFEVRPHEILGLLGPNGAGKTTILHMLLGLTLPTSGEIRIFGLDLLSHREQVLQQMNFSSTYTELPFSLTIRESLRVFALLYHVPKPDRKIQGLLETFGLADIKTKQVRTLSTGQRTRLNLCKALINDPRLLLLDEPTASLDPDIADRTRRFLRGIRDQGSTSILYTSHNMREMEEVCDRIVFLNKGRVQAEGTPGEVVRVFKGRDLEDAFLKVTRGEDDEV